MRTEIKIAAIVVAILFTHAAAFFIGGMAEYRQRKQDKDYQAACVLSDIVRLAMDHDETGEVEELYYEVIDNLDCYDLSITKEEIMRNYVWFY